MFTHQTVTAAMARLRANFVGQSQFGDRPFTDFQLVSEAGSRRAFSLRVSRSFFSVYLTANDTVDSAYDKLVAALAAGRAYYRAPLTIVSDR